MFRLRQRQRGQTIILLALLMGILMVIGALVIDVGSTHRVRTETHYVCDAAALGGMAEWTATRSSTAAHSRAIDICSRNGYTVGQNGVTEIIAYGYNHISWSDITHGPKDPPDTDRYYLQITRELPQYLAAVIGIRRTGTTMHAAAALIGAVPIDVDFGAQIGFPDRANLAQFGPDAPYTFGDPYSTKKLDNGTPNQLYNPDGYRFDMDIPTDYVQSTGTSYIRVEIYDPDTINRGTHVTKNPSQQVDTNGDGEPDQGGIDEIRATPPNGNDNTSPAQFPARSTETEWTVLDNTGTVIATARYGPSFNTPFWFQDQDPGSVPATTPTNPDPAQAQIATDLRWITPQGFQFDTSGYALPVHVQVHTLTGSSENGYGMRLSRPRAQGVRFNPAIHGVTNAGALAIYGSGRVPINFSVSDVTKLPIGEVPSSAESVVITNFDTDVGAASSTYTMSSFDATTGQGDYPVLFPAPASASGSNVVRDVNGNKYYTSLPGTLSTNGTFASDTKAIPQTVVVPQTDGSGHLVFDGQGRIIIVDQRDFEGGSLQITYTAGASDTSVWDVSFTSHEPSGDQHIVLIR
ncbi:MAG: Tad domain-containing protein [Armatimonadetes bacterium]|nr:Tad domain-containing protein [Armatimonadota bacterium]